MCAWIVIASRILYPCLIFGCGVWKKYNNLMVLMSSGCWEIDFTVLCIHTKFLTLLLAPLM